jgi:acetolactate synthase-1/2/3 large subunit
VELMEAARQRQMRFLLMKQEVAGAMLAATWGDLTGSPGVCLSTRGPGAANMVNGVAHAFLDRSPLIAITDAYSRPTYETGLRQRINQQAIYEPVVKWSTTLDAKTVRQQVRRAMRTATATPPGPVHFESPRRSGYSRMPSGALSRRFSDLSRPRTCRVSYKIPDNLRRRRI